MSQWQPIETAPKDGSDILLYQPEPSPPWIVCGFWSIEGESFGVSIASDSNDLFIFSLINPTHWMPLPDAPK